jgi:hypothetical protein
LGCGNPYWAQTGRKKSRQQPMIVYIHQNIDIRCEAKHVGKDHYAIFHCSNPRGMVPFWGTQYDSFACNNARYLRGMLLQHVLRSVVSG